LPCARKLAEIGRERHQPALFHIIKRRETPAASLDHLVGDREQALRHLDAELLRSLEVLVKTIGIVEVAAIAARAEPTSPVAPITETPSATSSAACAGSLLKSRRFIPAGPPAPCRSYSTQ
jgi:hypothetical protein